MADARTRVLVLLIAYFVVRLPWLFLVPMKEAPDEYAHFWILRFLTEHLRLPEATEILAGGPSAVYGSYPPFGYVPHVLTSLIGAKLAPAVDISLCSRFGSLIIGATLIPCADYFGQLLFSRSRLFALALPLLIVFHPQLVFVNAYANCDTTTAALAAVTLVLLSKILLQGIQLKYSLILGLVLGWLALTKYSGYSMFPTAALAIILAAWLHRTKITTFLLNCAVVAASALGLSAWWFIRNAAIFDGDYLGTKTMYHTWAVTFKRELVFHKSAWTFLKDHRWWRTIIYSYWGYFGYMTQEMARPLYIVYQSIMAVSIVTALARLPKAVQAIKALKTVPNLIASINKDAAIPAVWFTLIASFAINLGAMVYASMANFGLAQGRYLFPNEIPIMAMLLGGLYLLPNAWRNKAAAIFIAFNTGACIYQFFKLYSLPEYAFNFVRTYVQ
jgi:4-amino-4-deoxy-L-arabinose transferase-like glycosyltransferase